MISHDAKCIVEVKVVVTLIILLRLLFFTSNVIV